MAGISPGRFTLGQSTDAGLIRWSPGPESSLNNTENNTELPRLDVYEGR